MKTLTIRIQNRLQMHLDQDIPSPQHRLDSVVSNWQPLMQFFKRLNQIHHVIPIIHRRLALKVSSKLMANEAGA
jgi:hypothetical protein